MKYAILADIHANLSALEAVLADIVQKGGVDGYWSLGDIVGYGPDPNECLGLARNHRFISVAGNHDWAATGKISAGEFNREAAISARWTRRQITKENAGFLESLPLNLEQGDFTLVHGSPREPIREYILSAFTAGSNLKYFNTRYCLIGHSHLPQLYECGEACSLQEMAAGDVVRLGKKRLIINPGSVGQPRDSDPRPSYVIYDSDSAAIVFYRVEYDIRSVQQRMLNNGLPEGLISRLEYGL
jgi:predicted phosphodiesterase